MPLSLSHLYNLLGILQGRFFSSLPFAHVLTLSLYQCGFMDIYFILLYFFYNYSTWDIGNSSSWPLLTYSHQYSFYFFLSTSFHFGTKRLWYLIYFLFQSPSHISPRIPGSFYWRMVSEIKIWVPAVSLATRVSFLLGSPHWHRKKYM